mmetsp:Transcript_11816/g.17612  ORF Transcript_11816/g.17612 Transcript_11816/m.17612 type:complete len:440 (+) Transcript_11816:80-1399(+)
MPSTLATTALLLITTLFITMIRRTTSLALSAKNNDRIKVAILGSGMSGCSAAATLLDSPNNNFDVSVFEGGRGIGGRMSTRRITDESGNQLYQFDHGCQYISTPKTECFRKELEKWKERGWVQPWKGTFATVSAVSSDIELSIEEPLDGKEKYVGYPAMNTVCENLLLQTKSEQTINVVTGKQVRAVAAHSEEETGQSPWQVYHKDELLGSYDWLVVTDRNSAQELRPDLADANINMEFKKVNEHVESVKSCTTMIAFDEPLPLPFDGLTFDYNSNKAVMREEFKSLGWAARDSSKPGRSGNNESPECWVLQSNPEEALRLLELDELQGATLPQIREKIREQMVNDFIDCIPTLIAKSGWDDSKQVSTPKIVDSMGHRWGAAFPSFIKQELFKEMECQVFPEQQFVACGDYFGTYAARVEGAFLSGRAAANEVLKCVGR